MVLGLLRPGLVASSHLAEIRRVVSTCGLLLPTLIPRLRLSLGRDPTPSSRRKGRHARIRIVSSHNKTAFPFHGRSRNVVHVAVLLSFCVHICGSPGILITISRLSSNIFRGLLNSVLHRVTSNVQKRLVFATRGRRPLTILPNGYVEAAIISPSGQFDRKPGIGTAGGKRGMCRGDISLK